MALSFSHAVLVWARSKPADEAYDYNSPTNCAICQFLKETGRAKSPLLAENDWFEANWRDIDPKNRNRHYFDKRIDDAAIGPDEANDDLWTFGAFADRLEKALS